MTDPVSSAVISAAAAKLWFIFYGMLLLTWDMFFTVLPTTVIGITAVYCLLIYFRVPPPPPELVKEVFGEDANTLVEKYRQNQQINLDFVPTTTRLSLANGIPDRSDSKNKSQDSTDENPPYIMWTIAHRGACLDAPENSLSAFRLCKSRGCLAIEFDVAFTKDEVPVVFHDDKLDRIANIDRNIRDMTLEELSQIDISVNHPLGKKYIGERIPTFEEAISTCLDLGLRFFIDLKDPEPKMVQVVLDAYKKFGEPMYQRAIVSSFYAHLIYQIRRRDPRIIGCMAWRPSYHQYASWNGNLHNLECRYDLFIWNWLAIIGDTALKWALPNFLWWFIGLSALLINKDGVTKEEATRWMKRGLRIFAWTVNNPIEKLHLTHNFQMGCLTDTLDGSDVNAIGFSPPKSDNSKPQVSTPGPSVNSQKTVNGPLNLSTLNGMSPNIQNSP